MNLKEKIEKKRKQLEALKLKQECKIVANELPLETAKKFLDLVKKFEKLCPGSRVAFNDLFFAYGVRSMGEEMIPKLERILKERAKGMEIL